jgi:ATP-dependent Clp protease ATP-binding subunit ClpX
MNTNNTTKNETIDSKKCIQCPSCLKKDIEGSNDTFILMSSEQDLYICDKCIEVAHNAATTQSLINDFEEKVVNKNRELNIMRSPKEIYQELNKYVIGQDKAKKDISVAIAQHLRRIKDKSIKKSNILIMGPTGTGKTEIARTVSNFLKLPFVITEATNLTTRGYIGEDVESIIGRLLSSVDYNTDLASKGIIFIDEIDKLGRSQNSDSGVNTVAVQQELLKILEGTQVTIKRKSSIGISEEFVVDTSNILFICAGAFDGLINAPKENIVGIGAEQNSKEIVKKEVQTSDLFKYGFIPEFVGRFSVLTETHVLSKEDLFKILIEPENSIIKQKQKLFNMDHVCLEFSKDYLMSVVLKTIDEKTGARGLNRILETRLNELYFHIDKYKNQLLIISENEVIIKNNENILFEEKSAM